MSAPASTRPMTSVPVNASEPLLTAPALSASELSLGLYDFALLALPSVWRLRSTLAWMLVSRYLSGYL